MGFTVAAISLDGFKPVPDAPGYFVNCKGDVISFRLFKSGKKLKPLKHHRGYLFIYLHINKKSVFTHIHTMVARAFMGKPKKGMCVNHIDGVKTNNNLENLEYITQKQNVRHAMSLGLKVQAKGEQHGMSKITKEQAIYIYKSEKSLRELAKMFNVDYTNISCIKRGKTWAWATRRIES